MTSLTAAVSRRRLSWPIENAAALGVPAASIALAIRSLMAGDSVSELKDGADAYDIIVQLPLRQRPKPRRESLSSMKVRSTKGQLVDLANVVKANRTTGPTVIEHSSRQRQVMLLANLEGSSRKRPKDSLTNSSRRMYRTSKLPMKACGKVMTSHSNMIGSPDFWRWSWPMILAAQFNSFIQPITIMVSGALSVRSGRLIVLQMNLKGIYSMIGLIMLMGLVTKNAPSDRILRIRLENAAWKCTKRLSAGGGAFASATSAMTTVSLLLGMLCL